MIWFGNYYINSEEDTKNPYVAPLLAEDLSNLPPALVITAENDVSERMKDSLCETLKEAGVRVESICRIRIGAWVFYEYGSFPRADKRDYFKITRFDKVFK